MISCPTCVDSLAEHYGKISIDEAIKRVGYFCCFNTYATKFEDAKSQLIALRKELQKDIDDAEEKNETRVEDRVELWKHDADAIIGKEIKTKEKCFSGLRPNCIGRYQHGKELEETTQQITVLFERKSEFPRVARPPPKNPGMKYYAPQIFIDFKSRESKFKELVEALKSGNYYIIGLQGLGGMGKTTLAQQVGVHVQESEAFRQVIFTTVPDPPDINKIRRDIAEKLNFPLEGEEERHSGALWSRIATGNGKVLIILDDIWKTLELREIGIPNNHKNCCVLITTRNSEICESMGCQPTISLNTLKDRDGLDIFIKHVGKTSEDSTRQFMDQAQKIVKVCGGLPLAIVAIATMLKDFPLREWENILKPLLNSEPLHNSDYKDWVKVVHTSLKLSYDKLENKAKHLLLLCSLFPKDYEIPMEFLSKLGIGLRLFGEAHNYSSLRERLILAKKDLIKSFLLSETKEACVKMHDLVRDVVLWIEDKDVQVIMNSSGKLKSNLKFLCWSNNGFPIHFDGTKLEVLLLWIKGEVKVEDSYAVFKEMSNLRVLLLHCDKYVVKPTLSLQSFLSLKNIKTLILNDWILRDIFILKHLRTLVTLEFESCLITELLEEIVEIKSLRLLGIRRCRIGNKNPFEVIERCSQLEELFFVQNDDIDSKPKDKVGHGTSHPALKKYSVACSGLQCFVGDDNGLHKCFNTKHVKNLMSEEMFKYLVEGAEILELCKMGEARWKSLVPDIIPMRDGVMQGLIKLCLYDRADMECLVDNRGSSGGVGVFCDLAELRLDNMDAKDLYWGRMPSSFLSELKIFKLLHCKNLRNNFFYGNLKLPNLTVLQLDDCPMFKESIFGPSVARSLVLLEELSIKDCEQVETLVKYESPGEEKPDADHQNSIGFLFPNLKSVKIQGCGRLQLVLSVLLAGDLRLLQDLSIRSCERIEYIFGEYRDEGQYLHKKTMLPSLTTMELEAVPSFINICNSFNKCRQRSSPAQNCCCLPSESMKRNETSHPADRRPLTQSWSLRNKREMTPMEWPSLKHIYLGRELVKIPFPHSMVCLRGRQPNMKTRVDSMKLLEDMKNLTSLAIMHSEIEEIFNLEGIKGKVPMKLKLQVLEIQGLQKLRCIYKDPNNILNLCNLEDLVFSECDQLKAIFSTSTMKSLPQLSRLVVTQCRELIYIIEDVGGLDQISLPNLQKIRISSCNELKSLFSISTSSKLQKLESLEIEEASNLKEVFGCSQDDTQERVLEDVFPNLTHLKLKNLRNLERFCRRIDLQSVEKFVSELEVFECGIWGKAKELKRNEQIKNPQSKDSNTCQAMPHISDVGTSSQVHSHLEGEPKRKQEIEAQGLTTALPKSAENIEAETKKTGEEAPFSSTSSMVPSSSDSALTRGLSKEETMKIQANGPTPALEKKASQSSPAESKMTSTSLCTVVEGIPEDTVIMKSEVIPSSVDSHDGGSQSSQSTLSTKEPEKEIVGLPTSTRVHSHLEGEAIMKQGKETQGLTGALPNLAENKEETMKAQANGATPALEEKASETSPAGSNMTSTSLHSKEETMKTQANDVTPALEKKASETSPADSNMTSTSLNSNEAIPNGRLQGDLTPIADNKALMNSLATMVTPGRIVIDRIPEDTAIMKRKVVPSSIYSQFGDSLSNQSTLTKLKKDPKENVPHVIPSYHQGIAGPSSQILGIGEILEVTELKDGEPALLAKALELYPQLRLPREQRTHRIIAFSYRVLINILSMLANKSPSTITAADKLTLKANLEAATYFGFDKDWIQSVRTKVFGNDMFDVVATEEILVKKAKLETYSATLEQVQSQRLRAMEQVAVSRRQLDLVQSELEAIDSKLLGQLEERKKLIINMMQFREIIKAKYRPFGIY